MRETITRVCLEKFAGRHDTLVKAILLTITTLVFWITLQSMVNVTCRQGCRYSVSPEQTKTKRTSDKRAETLVDEEPDARIERFTHWSVELSAQAIHKALAQAGASVNDVTGLVVNTCTGYICPALSTYLIEKLGLSRTIRAYDLVGSGCNGAIPNLRVAESLLGKNGGGVVVIASVEICSATLQVDNDISLILSNALFGDGAAAAVLSNRPEGFEMVAPAGRYVSGQRDAIRYVHRSVRLPQHMGKDVQSRAKEQR